MEKQDAARPAATHDREGRGFVILTLEFHKEGRYWVGECRELGTATDGPSLDRVKRELAKLVTLHLDGLEEIGERERVFKERGIILYLDPPPTEIDRRVQVAGDDATDRLVQFKRVAMPPEPAELVPA